MQISIDTNVDSEKDIAAVADMLRTFLFERNKKVEGVDQWTAAEFAAMRARNLPPMVLPTIPPPPVDAPVSQVPPPPSLAASGTGESAGAAAPSTDITPPPAPPSASLSEPPAERELDGAGLPWDARIHSETRKRNTDGTWRLRRNLDAAIRSAVVSELRAAYPHVVHQLAVVPPPPPPAQVMVPPPPAAGAVPPGPPVGVQPGATQIAVTDFKSLMAKAGALMQAGKLTHPLLAQACVACGVASLPALMSQPDKIPAVDAWLTANVPP